VETHLEVNVLGDLVKQEIENGVGFRFGDAEYATGKARVDIDALPACYWVDTNDRVHSFDGLATDVEASRARSLRLRDRAVQSCETLEVCLHSWTEGRIKSIAAYDHQDICSTDHLLLLTQSSRVYHRHTRDQ
jgi:hypothetical protein